MAPEVAGGQRPSEYGREDAPQFSLCCQILSVRLLWGPVSRLSLAKFSPSGVGTTHRRLQGQPESSIGRFIFINSGRLSLRGKKIALPFRHFAQGTEKHSSQRHPKFFPELWRPWNVWTRAPCNWGNFADTLGRPPLPVVTSADRYISRS